MVEPRAKRRRTLVCNCTLCNGQERDHCTVQHHQSILLADASQSVHDDSTNLSNSFGEGSCTNETMKPHCLLAAVVKILAHKQYRNPYPIPKSLQIAFKNIF